jgi:Uncharacterised nucleotidyltransferase
MNTPTPGALAGSNRRLPVIELLPVAHQVSKCLAEGGINARLFGGLAIALVCSADRECKDIDIVVEKGKVAEAGRLLRRNGWLVDRRSAMFGDGRHLWLREELRGIEMDIYADPLQFNHQLRLGPRLDLGDLTIPPSDLMLTKLQIVESTEKDLDDVEMLLMKAHALDDGRIVDCCSHDWGLFYTSLRNLGKIASRQRSGGMRDDAAEINCRAAELQRSLGNATKSLKWWLRSLVGPRLAWYDFVD